MVLYGFTSAYLRKRIDPLSATTRTARSITWPSKIFHFKMAERAHFIAPVIEDNGTGWGPTSVSDAFKGIPYQPFSKADRLGKVRTQSLFNLFQVKIYML